MIKLDPSLHALAAWFENGRRILPWRDSPDFYRVWISEIMLQQTQVVTVVPYFERFLERFPSVEKLAAAPEEDVLLAWAGLGYYSRARNLHRAAQRIVAQGGFPRTREGWLEVPGVGPYTAGAILSIAADFPEAILDGNVERVLSRLRRVSRVRGDTAYKSRLWRLSRFFVEHSHRLGIRPSVLNQALMELGATLCSPKKPKCLLCPLAPVCRAQHAGESESFPPKKKSKEWINVEEALHCVISASGRVLLRKRTAGEWRAGLWDLLEAPPAGGAEEVGRIESRHVVTRHKIRRTTTIWKQRKLTAGESVEMGEDRRWISVGAPEVPVGSALKRTLQQISETFPEALEADL